MQAQAASGGHRFAVTEKGYIGLVPHCAQIGDKVALILGAPIPFILRETGGRAGDSDKGTMQLVGDAYIHGMIYGKAMDLKDFQQHDLWLY